MTNHMKNRGITPKYRLTRIDGEPENRAFFALIEGHPWTREALVALSRITDGHGFAQLSREILDWAKGMRKEAPAAFPSFDQAGNAAVEGDGMARAYWAALAVLTTREGFRDKTPEEAHEAVALVAAGMYAMKD